VASFLDGEVEDRAGPAPVQHPGSGPPPQVTMEAPNEAGTHRPRLAVIPAESVEGWANDQEMLGILLLRSLLQPLAAPERMRRHIQLAFAAAGVDTGPQFAEYDERGGAPEWVANTLVTYCQVTATWAGLPTGWSGRPVQTALGGLMRVALQIWPPLHAHAPGLRHHLSQCPPTLPCLQLLPTGPVLPPHEETPHLAEVTARLEGGPGQPLA
jgi:hypothetical protein